MEVDVHHRIEVLGRQLLERPTEGDAGIVDQQIDALVPLDDAVDGDTQTVQIGQIGDHGVDGPGGGGRTDGLRDVRETLGVPVEKNEIGSAAGEFVRHLFAHSTGCAGDERGGARETEGGEGRHEHSWK